MVMRIRVSACGLLAGVIALAAAAGRADEPAPVRGQGLVAADQILASQAGAEVLALGGNATDAAIAAALAAGVVQPSMSGLGGGGFAVWADGDDRGAFDFREVAPAAAHRDLFRTADGGVDPTASREGALAVGVPGEPRGLYRLLRERGTMTPAQVAAPAIRLATEGFAVGPLLLGSLERAKSPGILGLFDAGGAVPALGAVVHRPDLAQTIKLWAKTRGELFNTGKGASAVLAATSGGILTAEDLAAYAPKARDPLVVPWRGYTIVSMAPPSSGGIVLEQVLRALEDTDLAALGHNSPEYVHLLAEAMKHAYADRAHHLGDPDFVEVPVARLLSDERRDAIRTAFDATRTFGSDYYGLPVEPPHDAGTQHISVVDLEGRSMALTTTINTSFGSQVVVPGYGVILNNQMDDFAAAPGVPNAFGLVGTEANSVASGKRPLSSMTPTVILDGDGAVRMVVGASGGGFIPSGVIQVVLNILVFGMDPLEAVSAPRLHHQWMPDMLGLETAFPPEVVTALEAKGHKVRVGENGGCVQVVVRDGDAWAAASDPRKGGQPAAARP